MSDRYCECQIEFQNTYPDLKDDIHPKEFYTTIDFGRIEFGTKPYKILRLKNTSVETKEFSIRRDPNTNPIYYAFDFNISRAKIASGENLEIRIYFCPKVPRETCIDHLEILDDSTQFWICLKGESEGPVLSASTKLLHFYFKPNKYLNKLTFELKNVSKVATHFQFDVNEEEEFFRLNKLCGTIEPNCYEYVTVHFVAKKHGYYCRQLVCLNLYNEPIMIELFGIHTDNPDFFFDDINVVSFPLQINESRGYSGYLNDTVKILEQMPPSSFNTIHVDFGSMQPKCETFSKVISFTNHLEDEIEIIWENCDGVFRINPNQLKIQSTESVMFDINFNPIEPDTLYSRILTAKIFWMDNRQTGFDNLVLAVAKVPLTASIRILGHTFPENRTWIPQVRIMPEAVIFPVALPGTTSYTTFLLKSFGHLPVSFKFLPPKTTNFTLKPMIGIVKDFQIIVAQLQTDKSNKKAYVECWGVELNGNKENCIPFYMKGFSEYPSLQIGSSNVVKFNTIQYGCQERLNVCMKNNSGHCIEYNFNLKEHNYVNIDHPQGFLASNEIVYLHWYFLASPKAPPKSQLRCEIRPLCQMKSIRGQPIDIFATIYADFGYSELCATPSVWESTELLYGATTTTRFHIFNFGESPIHYLLNVDGDNSGNIVLTPTQGTLKNKENAEIMVVVNGRKLGSHKLNVYYSIRTHDDTIQLVNDHKYNIFTIVFDCVLPTIQILEIGYHNFGPLFSKLTLWEMFNVDAINKILLELSPGDTKQLKINAPGYEANEEILTANLLLYNCSNFDTNLVLKRKKLCECKLVEVSRGISFRNNIYDCPHRDLLNLEIANQHFYPHARNKLTITLNYTFQGLHTLGYVLQLCHNRTLELFINMDVLSVPTETACIYRPDYTLCFRDCFIGEKESLLEGFYIYNNTSTDVWFSIDLEMLQRLRTERNFEIFTCLNPEGHLEPFTSCALLFKFTPIEAKKYQVMLPITIGEKMYELNLCGEGIMKENLEKMSSMALVNKRNLLFDDDRMVSLSTEHITAVLPVWSKTQKLFFIKNITKDKVIGYSFQSSCVEGSVEANVLFRKGTLNPKESHGIIIEIHSFDKPSILRLQLACKLLNHTQYVEHRKTEAAYYMKEIELRDYFIITENGISYPKNDVVIVPTPEVFYLTLAITTVIIGVRDRDLYFSVTEQLQQAPQYTIRLNPANILNTISAAHDTLDDPILSLYSLKKNKENQPQTKENKTEDKFGDLLQYYKEILNYCIADVVFGESFNKIFELITQTKSPYYVQFTTDAETKYEDRLSYVNSRKKLLGKYLQQPQAPIVADIFQELIADCVHEMFHLGSQVKHRRRDICLYNVGITETHKCAHL